MSYRLINANDIAEKYPEVNDMPAIYADLENGLDNKYHFVSSGISDEEKDCYVLNWAKKELELALKTLENEKDEATREYAKKCYISAMTCYRTLVADNHSGSTMGITKNIINRLISVKPLTPIEDTEDVWQLCEGETEKDGKKKYQCKRMASLFKTIDKDGNVSYDDNTRVVCRNMLNGDRFYYGFVSNLIDKLVPITMPYNPSDKGIIVCVKDFTLGDYHYLGIYSAALPGHGTIDINKFTKINEKANIAAEMEQGEFEKLIEDHKDVILKDIV